MEKTGKIFVAGHRGMVGSAIHRRLLADGYAVAKLAGVKMMECSRRQYGLKGSSPIPCNLYGTNDSFYPRSAHVLSSLVGKFVNAVDEAEGEVTVWGTGVARREFLHVDDLADAVLFLMTQPDPPEIINVGSGFDVSIRELAGRVAHAAGFGGKLLWDASKPDGMPRKCLDVARMTRLGFRPRIGLEEGIAKTVAEYRDRKKGTRKP